MNEASGLYFETNNRKDMEQIVATLSLNSHIKGTRGDEFRLALIVVMLRALQYAIGVLRAEGKNLPALTDEILRAIGKWSTGDLDWKELYKLQHRAYADWRVIDRQLTKKDQQLVKKNVNAHHEILFLLGSASQACVECDPSYQLAESENQKSIFSCPVEIQSHGVNLLATMLTTHIAITLMDILGGELKDWTEKIRDNAILANPI